jgi:hypothetical protein
VSFKVSMIDKETLRIQKTAVVRFLLPSPSLLHLHQKRKVPLPPPENPGFGRYGSEQ